MWLLHPVNRTRLFLAKIFMMISSIAWALIVAFIVSITGSVEFRTVLASFLMIALVIVAAGVAIVVHSMYCLITVEIVSGKVLFSLLSIVPDTAYCLRNIFERYLFSVILFPKCQLIFIICIVDIDWLFIYWALILLHLSKIRNWIWTIPTLISELLRVLGIRSLIPSAHFIQITILKHILIQGLVSLRPCLLLEMLFFRIAYVRQ